MGSRTPGGLLAEITSHSVRPGSGCSMAIVEAQLTPADLTDLRAAYADASITNSAIFRALKARNLPVRETAVGRHRKGTCQCTPAGTG